MNTLAAPHSAAARPVVVRPAVSFVVEWENANRIGAERSLEMFARLAAQIRETGFDDYEIVLVSGEPMPEDLRADIVATDGEAIGARIRFLTAHDRNYYRQKMAGVRASTGRTVLFLDSDVVPEPGWLAAMLAGLADPSIQVLFGATYLEPPTNIAKLTTSLFWIYDPAPPPGVGPIPSTKLFVNNVAFRRALIEQHPFPESETNRGQCAKLNKILRKQGITVWRAQDARVEHPSFGTLGELAERSWSDGADIAIELQEQGRGRLSVLRNVVRAWWMKRRRSRERLARRYREVGGGPWRSALSTVLRWGMDLVLLSAGVARALRGPGRSAAPMGRQGTLSAP